MASKEEKNRKKLMLEKIALENLIKEKDKLPFDVNIFNELFDYVDSQVVKFGCDHTLVFTRKFLEKNNLSVEKSMEWFQENGGFCDCEIFNAEDIIESIQKIDVIKKSIKKLEENLNLK